MTETDTNSKQSFNEEFCTHLEYHLGATFEKSNRENLKGFWCDGVSWFPPFNKQITKKSVNDTRKIVTKAWIGKTESRSRKHSKAGEGEYEMTIYLGKHSLRRYARGTSLIDCIPSDKNMDWVDIDIKMKTIAIRLK